MSTLTLVIIVAGIFTFGAWLLSVITKDTSQVDRIWSITPEVYLWLMSGKDHFHNKVLLTMTLLVTAWGARLTFNFARKGGYSGEEDYRWEVLRQQMKPWQYQIFNIFFISIYQNFLLLIITMPGYYVYQHHGTFTAPTIIAVVLFALALLGETIADQQQWNFHQLKKAGKTEKGFLDYGLFKISRHPNFFFEQSQWWILYAIGGFATAHLINLSLIGPVLLTALFLGSTRFTESISLSKYPDYAIFQKTTPAIIPWIGWKKRS